MDINNPCYSPDDEDIIHTGMQDTGERGTNPISGDTYQVWTCKCQQKTWEVYPR